MRPLNIVAGALGICAVLAGLVAFLEPRPPTDDLPREAVARPSTWPDYSPSGPGFVPPATPDGHMVAYGYRLIADTPSVIGPSVNDQALRLAGNNLACQSCHLDAGTNRFGLPLVGVFRTYPKFSTRSGRVISLVERIDECMTRSMNGRRLPEGSREQEGFLAYLKYIGTPEAVVVRPAPGAPERLDAARGADAYGRLCAACHQSDGLGKRRSSADATRGYEFPPLWGPDSFNDGAGMDRYEHVVGFVRRTMPRGVDPAKPSVSLQEAWDVAAFLQSRSRPPYAPGR
ncbi:MAG TPA: c-type cytochrome [Reyranella sp.]|nr:c-type cytochrome [Reyranella sp.]